MAWLGGCLSHVSFFAEERNSPSPTATKNYRPYLAMMCPLDISVELRPVTSSRLTFSHIFRFLTDVLLTGKFRLSSVCASFLIRSFRIMFRFSI